MPRKRDGRDLLPLAPGIWRFEGGPVEAAKGAGGVELRWSLLGVFDRIFAALASEGAKSERIMIDATLSFRGIQCGIPQLQ